MKSIVGLSITPSLIGWIITGVAGLFLLAGLIWGIIRGLKKTAFRALWLVVTAVVLLFLTPVITKAIVGMNLSFLSISVNGAPLISINQLILDLLTQTPEIASIIASNPATLDLISRLPLLLANTFVFAILFWMTKIILWPVWAIVAKCCFKNKNDAGEKVKKHRGFGMLVGMFLGVFVGALTLMPVLGFVDIANQIEMSTKNSNNANSKNLTVEEGGLITQLAGSEVAGYLESYDKSALKQIYKYTGVEFMNNTTFNYLTTINFKNEKIQLRSELQNVLVTIQDVQKLTNANLKTMTKEEITAYITTSKKVISKVFDIKLVVSLGNELLPYIINEMLTNPEFIIKLPNTGTEEFDTVIQKTLETFKTVNMNELKNEILALIDCVSVLNDNDVLVPVLQNKVTKPIDIANLITEKVINDISENLFKMKTVGTVVPLTLNAAFVYAAKALDVANFENTGNVEDIAKLKETFKSLLTTSVALINTLDMNSQFYVTKNSLPHVGTLLNSIKDYSGLTTESYNKLLLGVEKKINNQIDKLITDVSNKIPDSLLNSLKTSVEKLRLIEDFKAEFDKYVPIFDDAVSFVESLNKNEIDLMKAGKIIDSLKHTDMFGANITEIIAGGIDIITNSIPEEDEQLAGIKTILNNIKKNIVPEISYETDLPKLSSLVEALNTMVNTENLENSLLNGSLLLELGSALDSAKTSALLGNQVNNLVAEIVSVARSVISVPESLKAQLDQIFDELELNIKNETPKVWATEFANLKEIILILNNNTSGEINFSAVGKTLDYVTGNSVILNKNLINNLVKILLDESIKNSGITLEHELANITTVLKSNLDLVISYEKEFLALEQFMNDINDIKNINITTTNLLENFGEKLDSYQIPNGSNASYLICNVRPLIIDYLIGCAIRSEEEKPTANQTVIQILNDMKLKIANIDSYKTELKYLQDTINMFKNGFDFDITGDSITVIGKYFDELYLNSKLLKDSGNIATKTIFATINFSNLDAGLVSTIDDIKQNTLTITTRAENRIGYETAYGELVSLQSILTNFNVDISMLNQDLAVAFNNLQDLNVVGFANTKNIVLNSLEQMKTELNKINVTTPDGTLAKQAVLLQVTNKTNEITSTVSNINYVTSLSEMFKAIKLFTQLYPKA